MYSYINQRKNIALALTIFFTYWIQVWIRIEVIRIQHSDGQCDDRTEFSRPTKMIKN